MSRWYWKYFFLLLNAHQEKKKKTRWWNQKHDIFVDMRNFGIYFFSIPRSTKIKRDREIDQFNMELLYNDELVDAVFASNHLQFYSLHFECIVKNYNFYDLVWFVVSLTMICFNFHWSCVSWPKCVSGWINLIELCFCLFFLFIFLCTLTKCARLSFVRSNWITESV